MCVPCRDRRWVYVVFSQENRHRIPDSARTSPIAVLCVTLVLGCSFFVGLVCCTTHHKTRNPKHGIHWAWTLDRERSTRMSVNRIYLDRAQDVVCVTLVLFGAHIADRGLVCHAGSRLLFLRWPGLLHPFSHKVPLKSSCTSQFPHKAVNLSLIYRISRQICVGIDFCATT